MDCNNLIYFSHGRTALKYGLKLINLENKSKILVPDYICEIVNIVIKKSGYEIESYPLKNNFRPDWEYLNKIKLTKIKAILMVHYFGFPQNINRFKNFCKKNKLILIEDNAHGFSGSLKRKFLGSYGDIGFTSIGKNLDLTHGGILYGKNLILKNNISREKSKYFTIFVRTILNYFPNIKYNIKKILFGNRFFRKFFFSTDHEINYKLIDNLSLKILKQINIKEEKKKRILNYKIWTNFLKRKNIKPINKAPNNNLMIWCLPFYTKKKEDAKKWYEWGYKNGITIFPWPNINTIYFNGNKKLITRWEKLVCLPLNISTKYLYKICK